MQVCRTDGQRCEKFADLRGGGIRISSRRHIDILDLATAAVDHNAATTLLFGNAISSCTKVKNLEIR